MELRQILSVFNLSELSKVLEIPYHSLKRFKRGEYNLRPEHEEKILKFLKGGCKIG